MSSATPLVNLAPTATLLAMAALAAALPLGWWGWRHRRSDARGRMAALTALTLFLTFDLIVFGAFTRLSDSGLGCPDWPGCYGQATPWAAQGEIAAAQAAMPSGPVTFTKAWIEMVHRYLAMTVGALILVMAVVSTVRRAVLPHALAWPLFTLFWVVLQGVFGKYTVTLKLYPAVVTLHLLGGMVLLALLMVQRAAYRPQPLQLPSAVRRLAVIVAGLLTVQIALGGWVSTNYAVLACTGFPTCNGQWWPAMDFVQGFVLLRELGRAGHGGLLPFEALVAIQMVHRLFAAVLVVATVLLVRRLWSASAPASPERRHAGALAVILFVQVASGLSNVVLGWPLAAALGHTAGAALWVGVTVSLIAGAARTSQRAAAAADRRWQPA